MDFSDAVDILLVDDTPQDVELPIGTFKENNPAYRLFKVEERTLQLTAVAVTSSEVKKRCD